MPKLEILPAPTDAEVLAIAATLAETMAQRSNPHQAQSVNLTPWMMQRLAAMAERGRSVRV